MGKTDVILKQWLKNKERFADLFNAVVFDGEQVIKPEELEELNSESGIVIASAIGERGTDEENEQRKKMYHRTEQRYRDLVMRWKGKTELAVLALENQGKKNGMVQLNCLNCLEQKIRNWYIFYKNMCQITD